MDSWTGPGRSCPEKLQSCDRGELHYRREQANFHRKIHMALVAIQAEDASELWTKAWQLLGTSMALRPNRTKGDSWEELHVCASLRDPRQRWVMSRTPTINPAFAVAEVVWILAGRGDTEFLTNWNASYVNYVGRTEEAYGAYGPRLRNYGGIDQLDAAFHALSAKPRSRQVLLNLWNPSTDLPLNDGFPRADDIPCNILSLLKVADGRLHWTQVMRSNDLVRGLPYNLIQWTTIHEVLAGWLGLDLGEYVHYSDSLHVYERDRNKFHACDAPPSVNTDTLAMPYADFTLLLPELELAFERMARARTDDAIDDVVNAFSCPEGYLNWIRVAASEQARKTGSNPMRWVHRISSPMLRQATLAWISQRRPAS